MHRILHVCTFLYNYIYIMYVYELSRFSRCSTLLHIKHNHTIILPTHWSFRMNHFTSHHFSSCLSLSTEIKHTLLITLWSVSDDIVFKFRYYFRGNRTLQQTFRDRCVEAAQFNFGYSRVCSSTVTAHFRPRIGVARRHLRLSTASLSVRFRHPFNERADRFSRFLSTLSMTNAYKENSIVYTIYYIRACALLYVNILYISMHNIYIYVYMYVCVSM